MGEMEDMWLDDVMEAYWEGALEEADFQAAEKVCRYCGEGGLRWRSTDKGWRLFGRDGVHSCKQYGGGRRPANERRPENGGQEGDEVPNLEGLDDEDL